MDFSQVFNGTKKVHKVSISLFKSYNKTVYSYS